MKKIYVTGTDTGVGKTYFSALYAKYHADKGLKVCYIKPVQTGYPEDDDAAFVKKFSGLEHCTVLHTAKPPVAPYIAFDEFPFDETLEAINAVSGFDLLIVEGAGGIMVPLDREYFNFDIAKSCGLSVLCVTANRLGCVNHSLLTKNFADGAGLDFAGFAVNNFFAAGKFDSFNIPMLNDLTDDAVRCVFSEGIDYIDVNW
jgi:dethiobiotin synthetase